MHFRSPESGCSKDPSQKARHERLISPPRVVRSGYGLWFRPSRASVEPHGYACRPIRTPIAGERMRRTLLSFAIIAGLASSGTALGDSAAASKPVARQAASHAAAQQLADLFDREWQWRLAQSPMLASSVGERGSEDRLDPVGAKVALDRLPALRAFRAELERIDLSGLAREQRINARIFRAQLDNAIAGIEVGEYWMPLNSDSSFFSDLAMMARAHRFDDPLSVANYVKRLKDIPRYFDAHIELLKEAVKRGYTLPKVVLAGREAPLKRVTELTDLTQSAFYQPLLKLGPAIPAEQADALRAEALQVLEREVKPAYQRLEKYFVESYVPKARATLAAEALPNGKAYYRAQILNYTTLDTSPEAIHQTGLAEVARIRADMEAIRREVGFDGDLGAFFTHLRTAPEFYAKTPEELLMRASYIAKRIDGLLPRYFGKLPRLPYTVAPVPEAIAPYYTTGRYVPAPQGSTEPGTYWVNTWKLEARPLFVLPALTLHEAVPGHHLQGALADEQTEQPNFRRFSYISAYGEGWALYTEWLGEEMGVYTTPYERFGRLTYEMWRACRLVVDTGVHAKRWSRQQALDYMRDNTALSEHEITTEVDRYISWPGQALSYKLGELKLRELRARAEQTLGADFDLRAFHDTVLALGSVPLPVLEEEVDRWIAGRGAP